MWQDYLILEGLLSPYTNGTEKPSQITEVVLARSAAALGARSRPHPRPRPQLLQQLEGPHLRARLSASRSSRCKSDGTMDLSQAYDAGIGAWDKVSIQFGYSHFAPGTDEAAALRKILDDAWDAGCAVHDQSGSRRPSERRSVEQRHGRRGASCRGC